MNINDVVDVNDFKECMKIGYNKLLDELEFIQRVCELHGMPSDIAERMTETAFGIVEDCKSDIDGFLDGVDSYAKYTELNNK